MRNLAFARNTIDNRATEILNQIDLGKTFHNLNEYKLGNKSDNSVLKLKVNAHRVFKEC